LLSGGNIFTTGKQMLAASASAFAALNFPNIGAVPTTPVTGDLWLTTGDNHLQFQSAAGLKSLAFTTDIAAGTVTGTGLTSGQLIVGNGGSAIGVGNLSGDVSTSGGTITTLASVGAAGTFTKVSTEVNFEILMGETLTLPKFFCRMSTTLPANVTFQVFDSAGIAVAGGTCVITTGSTSASSTGNTITLTAGSVYAVKATLATGTF